MIEGSAGATAASSRPLSARLALEKAAAPKAAHLPVLPSGLLCAAPLLSLRLSLFRLGTPLLCPHPLSLGAGPGLLCAHALPRAPPQRGAEASLDEAAPSPASGALALRLVGLGRLDHGCSLLVGYHVATVSRASRLTDPASEIEEHTAARAALRRTCVGCQTTSFCLIATRVSRENPGLGRDRRRCRTPRCSRDNRGRARPA